MEQNLSQKKTKRARRIGSGWFILLSILYIGFDAYYHVVSWSCFVGLALSCLPLLIPKRIVSLLFGAVTGFVTLYIGAAFLLSSAQDMDVPTGIAIPVWFYAIGYGIIFFTLAASLLLVYSALSISEKRFSLL